MNIETFYKLLIKMYSKATNSVNSGYINRECTGRVPIIDINALRGIDNSGVHIVDFRGEDGFINN